MSMSGLALLPLMDILEDAHVTQKWYADDGNAVGKLEALRTLHDKLEEHGHAFGYNITKCHLITKSEYIDEAKELFKNKDVELVDGHRVLGSVIGSPLAEKTYKSKKSIEYSNVLKKLASHSKKSPQNVYHALTKGVQHKLTFLSRTTPDIDELLEDSEKIISEKIIPNITGQDRPTEPERKLFSLPLRNGGLNIMVPQDRKNDLRWSRDVASHLNSDDITTCERNQNKAIVKIKKEKSEILKSKTTAIETELDETQRYATALASEKVQAAG